MISCLLLSAGESSRFGKPKALARLGNTAVIERLLDALIRSNVDGISIILGHHENLIRPFILKHRKVNIVYNKDYKFGQTSSFQAGLSSLNDGSRAVFLLPVDYPLVKTETINTLIERYESQKHQIIIPSFQGRKGHPPLFCLSLRQEFMSLDFEQGINTVARHHRETTTVLEVNDPGVVLSFNTPEEFEGIRKRII